MIAAWANAEVRDKLDVLPNLKALLLTRRAAGEWIEGASPDGAVVALGPEWLISHIDRTQNAEQLVRILQEAAGRRDLVAGRLSVARTEG